jgi:hypothetical protein
MFSEITAHWAYLAVVLLLLWFPRQWLRTGKKLFKKRRQHPGDKVVQFGNERAVDPDDKSLKLGKEFKSPRNYVDFLRAAAGGWGLVQFAFEAHSSDSRLGVLLLQGLILLVATLIQTLRRNEKILYFAPVFFGAGLAIGFCGPVPGLFGFLLVLLVNPAIPNPRWFLTAQAAAILVFGLYYSNFANGAAAVGITAGLIALPVLCSLLSKRPLVVYSKRSTA